VNADIPPRRPSPVGGAPDPFIEGRAFESAYGEPLERTLDLDTWGPGGDLAGLYERLEEEVRAAVRTERALRRTMRQDVLPRLRTRRAAPPGAGYYQASVSELEHVHRALLFNGAVEACDGTSVMHDTLPATITQIGVCLVSYQGDQGSWAQRLYRRDLRNSSGDPLDNVMAVLDERLGSGVDGEERGRLNRLARHGIMAYAERAILAYKASASWRIGHGNPASLELLTGLGSIQLLNSGMQVLWDLIAGHRKFLFVPSAPSDRFLVTIGHALHPLEFAVVDTAKQAMLAMVGPGHYTRTQRRQVEEFCDEVGDQLVRGVYRASSAAQPYLFYSHVDHVHEAALLAMADSVLQEHRGFPMLIDLADMICRTTFGNDIFTHAVQAAYVNAGAPYRFLPERQGRS